MAGNPRSTTYSWATTRPRVGGRARRLDEPRHDLPVTEIVAVLIILAILAIVAVVGLVLNQLRGSPAAAIAPAGLLAEAVARLARCVML